MATPPQPHILSSITKAQPCPWPKPGHRVTVTCDGVVLSWRLMNPCQPLGNGDLIPYFAFLMCMAFTFPIKLSLSHPMSFTVLIIYVILQWGDGRAWGLADG